ncbi:MAG: nitroreductase family protein [Desulfobulbaceae bacterium]|jgi:nitroreductase|nr:nitroreductase family protein [Desulfobulbaceae bacterium]
MEFFETVQKRRSIRQFTSQPVEQEKIEQILEAALRAPTARATRSAEIVVVTNREMLQKLANAKPMGAAFIAEAAVAMVVVANTEKSGPAIEDAAIAAFSMQLAAQALGLGSCWSHMRDASYDALISSSDYICQALGIPRHLMIECVIAIGYAAEGKKSYAATELGRDRIHYGQY